MCSSNARILSVISSSMVSHDEPTGLLNHYSQLFLSGSRFKEGIQRIRFKSLTQITPGSTDRQYRESIQQVQRSSLNVQINK